MKACMGGWCLVRNGCRHYGFRTPHAAERLCVKGRDGVLKRPPEVDEFPLRHPTPSWVPVHFSRRVA